MDYPFAWFERPRVSEEGLPYKMWYLVQDSGRVLATIEEPTVNFCYSAVVECKQDRLYIHLAGAKEWCEQQARTMLSDDIKQRALKRRGCAATRAPLRLAK